MKRFNSTPGEDEQRLESGIVHREGRDTRTLGSDSQGNWRVVQRTRSEKSSETEVRGVLYVEEQKVLDQGYSGGVTPEALICVINNRRGWRRRNRVKKKKERNMVHSGRRH